MYRQAKTIASNETPARVRLNCLALLATLTALIAWFIMGSPCVAQPDAKMPKSEASDPVYVESGIAGVVLQNSDSGQQFIETHGLGTMSDDGLMHNFYENASGSEILDLIQHPGSNRHSFSEAVFFRPDCFPLGAVPIKSKRFVSSRGVKLGLGASDVRRMLGRPHEVKTRKSGKVTYKYTCDNPATCPSLAKYNVPTYTAVAEFANGRLVKYSFGYDYP